MPKLLHRAISLLVLSSLLVPSIGTSDPDSARPIRPIKNSPFEQQALETGLVYSTDSLDEGARISALHETPLAGSSATSVSGLPDILEFSLSSPEIFGILQRAGIDWFIAKCRDYPPNAPMLKRLIEIRRDLLTDPGTASIHISEILFPTTQLSPWPENNVGHAYVYTPRKVSTDALS